MSARQECARRIRGVYVLVGSTDGDPVRLGARVLEGGGRLLQLRCKGWTEDEVVRAGRELMPLCVRAGATLVLNDSPEVAVACDAHGVHLGQTDGPTPAARAILGPDRILGRSTHHPDQVLQAVQDADYLAFGPVFDTPHLSRPKEVRGLEALRQVRALIPPGRPLVAIGGITAERLDPIREAGADAWAVIRAVADAPDPVAAVRALQPPDLRHEPL